MKFRELRRGLLGVEFSTRLRRARHAWRRPVPIPQVKLSPAHVARLAVVPDRSEFLRRMPQDAVVAEIGVDRGDFSARILELARPRCLHLIDFWGKSAREDPRAELVQRKFEAEIRSGRVRIHRGFSYDVLKRFDDGTFDWVYIDTDHSYATTRLELKLAAAKVRRGGIIAGHDYVTGNWDGYVRYGVVEAVHQFCVEQGWEFAWLTAETDRHLSFALRSMGA